MMFYYSNFVGVFIDHWVLGLSMFLNYVLLHNYEFNDDAGYFYKGFYYDER